MYFEEENYTILIELFAKTTIIKSKIEKVVAIDVPKIEKQSSMLARRDLVQNDDELIQLEKDLIYKFKRLRLDSPEDLFSSNNIQVIKKMDQLNLAMAEEPSQ